MPDTLHGIPRNTSNLLWTYLIAQNKETLRRLSKQYEVRLRYHPDDSSVIELKQAVEKALIEKEKEYLQA